MSVVLYMDWTFIVYIIENYLYNLRNVYDTSWTVITRWVDGTPTSEVTPVTIW